MFIWLEFCLAKISGWTFIWPDIVVFYMARNSGWICPKCCCGSSESNIFIKTQLRFSHSFWTHFCLIEEPFWLIWGPFWVSFVSLFVPQWSVTTHLGTFLGLICATFMPLWLEFEQQIHLNSPSVCAPHFCFILGPSWASFVSLLVPQRPPRGSKMIQNIPT